MVFYCCYCFRYRLLLCTSLYSNVSQNQSQNLKLYICMSEKVWNFSWAEVGEFENLSAEGKFMKFQNSPFSNTELLQLLGNYLIWATTCTQWRLWSACASMQFVQSLLPARRNFASLAIPNAPSEDSDRLPDCSGWSESLLGTHVRKYIMT